MRFIKTILRLLIEAPTVKEIYRTNLVASISLLALILFAFFKFNFLGPRPEPLQPGELDLSGTWKINLLDDVNFFQASLDDSSWCLIGVPNPNIELQKGLNDHPSKDCPKEAYPKDKMRGSTYWYRKNFVINENMRFKEPSLFLGAIKTKSHVYLDGKLIGITNLKDGTGMTTLSLEQTLVTPGLHVLAIRVQSDNVKYPGIFHAYPRKVALGESSNNTPQFNRIINEKYVTPTATLFVQVTCLLLLITLLAKGKGTNSSFFWLSIYFAASAIKTSASAANHPNKELIGIAAELFLSTSICGFALEASHPFTKHKHLWGKIFLVGAFLSSVILFNQSYSTLHDRLSLAFIIFPFSFWIYTVFTQREKNISKNRVLLLVALFVNHTLLLITKMALNIPIVTYHSLINSIVNLAMAYLVVDEYTKQERTLAFFGRFIRPGLKDLLQENFSNKQYSDVKVFRGRKVAIMKVDIVNHTQTTFQMPYGIKRLFQDTWFSVIDQIVADKVFLDKNVGDGSIYCFSENKEQGSCKVALNAALEIRNYAIAMFDSEFYSRLKVLLDVTPELKLPAEEFFKKYVERVGHSFWDRQTNVRIALAYGFVDEGLWGLTAQSHYDVQGDLVSLVARIESKALEGEILMDINFRNEIGEAKLMDLGVNTRIVELKGIGKIEVWCLKIEKDAKKKFAS